MSPGSAVARAPVAMDMPPLARRPLGEDRDADLVAALRRQEPQAIEALIATYGDRAYRLALRITGNPSDAEEVVQDALWSVSRKIDMFRGTAAFGSWVYRITANAAYQKRRGRRVERNATSWDDVAPSLDQHGQLVHAGVDWSPKLKDAALQHELHDVLSAAIDLLPVDSRVTFVLHDVEGLSSAEIAEILSIKPGTVKSQVHRARLFLRKRLAGYVAGDRALALG
jgi:RNA polymerase sigma-70 factor (ECF subfamily)